MVGVLRPRYTNAAPAEQLLVVWRHPP